jgi:hypothetical protein
VIAVERLRAIDLPRQPLASRASGPSAYARLLEGLGDGLLVILLVFALPLIILLLGLPLAIVIRVIVEIAQRF